MDQLEQVERLREKAGCSYREAKAALEQNGYDLLEALCWLEEHGKTALVADAASTEQQEPPKEEQKQSKPESPGIFVRGIRSLWEGLVAFVRSCNDTELVMTGKEGRREFGMPLLVAIVLACMAFWPVVALMVTALFFGNRFSLEGTLGRRDVNEVLGRATDFAECVKDKLKPDEDEES